MKNTIYLKLLIFTIILFILLIIIFSFTYISSLDVFYKNLIIFCSSSLAIINFLTILYFSTVIRRKKQIVLNKFDTYIEKEISKSGSGALLLDNSLEIIWASNFLEQKFNKILIGKKVTLISPTFKKNFELNKKTFIFELNEIFFEAKVNYSNNILILKDVTMRKILEDQYKNEKLVIGEMEIDNFGQIQSLLSEEEIFKVQTIVIQMIDDLVSKYNISYRQYVQGKFLIFTDIETLEKLKLTKFQFLDESQNVKTSDNLIVTVSIGFGVGTNSFKKLVELAKDGLIQSASRGGNQVTINTENEKPQYFGSKSEIDASTSRVEINQVANLFENKLASPKIQNVIVYSHKLADLDAIGAAFGIKYISKMFQKKCYIQIQTFDNTTLKVLNNSFSKEEINETFISGIRANKISNKENTLVVLVDTSYVDRTENLDAYKNVSFENVFIFDHHRRFDELEKDIIKNQVYIDSKASSASEIITEILRFMKKIYKINKTISQFLLNGIYLDTNQFTKSTSSKTFSAASWLKKNGANSSISSNILKIPEKKAIIISEVMSKAKEVKPGFFLSVHDGEIPEDIISIIANEMLRIEGRKATFVIAKLPGQKFYKMSARGINTNVQIIAESVGGGGNFSSSAATSSEPIKVFKDNLIQSIVSEKSGGK